MYFGTWIYAGHAKIQRCSILGFFPKNPSSGVILSRILWGLLFCMYIVVTKSSPHNNLGRSWSCSMALTHSSMDQYFILATPLFWGLYETISSILILASLQKATSYLELYSPPLSSLKVLILFLVIFSTSSLNSWNLLNSSSLEFKRYIQIFLEWSSINVT